MLDKTLGTVACRDHDFTVFGPRTTEGKRLGLKLPYDAWPRLLYALAHPTEPQAGFAIKNHHDHHRSRYEEVKPGGMAEKAERWWLRQGYGRVPPLDSEAYEGMLKDYGNAVASCS